MPTANSELNVGVTTLTDICVNVKGKGDVLLKNAKITGINELEEFILLKIEIKRLHRLFPEVKSG